MKCKFFNSKGQPSKLYDNLINKYGEQIAKDTWYYTKTQEFKNKYPFITENQDGEASWELLELNNLIVDFSAIVRQKESKANFEFKAKEFQQMFAEKGVNIKTVENLNLDKTATIVGEGNEATIEYNPNKIRTDSVYHEFGHALVDLIGYETPLIQNAIAEVRGTMLYNNIQILNPNLNQEQLDKEVLTTKIGLEADRISNSKFTFFFNQIKQKLQQLLGISPNAVDKLVNQLVNKKIDVKLEGKIAMYEQHQQDLRVIKNVFVTKQTILEDAIIKIEQKLRDYFSALEPEQRFGNPIFRDFTNLSEMLKEQRTKDVDKGIIEFITFAYTQTQLLEERIDAMVNPDRISERPEVTSTFLRDLMNYNEAFGDIMQDLQGVIDSNYLLKQELENYKPKVDESVLSYVPKIRERYEKVKRLGKMMSIEHVANIMLNTGENNKFVEHLKNNLRRQWVELGTNRELLLKDEKEGRKQQDAWADSEIARLKNWKHEGEADMLQNVTRQYYLNLLQQTTNDIGWFDRWLLAGNMINDEIIQYGSELLDKADFTTRVAMTNEFRDSIDLHDRYAAVNTSSNQQKKYEPLIEKEVQLNDDGSLSFTGKNKQQLVSKYYSKFFDLRSASSKEVAEARNTFGEDSPEHIAAWDKHQKFLDDNTNRPYNELYYLQIDSLSKVAKDAAAPLKKRKKQILQRYSVTAKNNVFNLTDITEDDAEALKNVEKELKELSSKYSKTGELKTGKSLKIAEDLDVYNKMMNEMYDEGEFQKESYDKAWGRAIKKGKGDEFVEKNTYTAITKQFWQDLQDAFIGGDPEGRAEIQNLLKNFKNKDGNIILDELDDNAVKILKGMYESLARGKLATKKWFFENVEINVRPEYNVKLAEMKQLEEDGKITEKQYQNWYNDNHVLNSKGEPVPLSFWTNLKPRTDKYFELKYNKYWYTTKVKDEYVNKNVPAHELGGLKDKWLNLQYSNLNGVNKEMYDYLTKRIEEDDKPLYNDYKLVTTDDLGNKYYKLPAVIKDSDTEILGDDGIGGFFANKYRRVKAALSGKKEDSTEFGGDILESLYTKSNEILLVQADEQGKERHRVPVNLRSPIGLEDQSFDLMTIALLNHHMSLNFQNKQEIAHDLELMADVLSERDVVETESTFLKGSKKKVNNLLGAVGLGLLPVNKKGEGSNAYKAFASMMEARLYGIRNKGSVRGHQIASVLTRYTGTTALALNIFSAGSNLVSGRLQNYILAAGNQFIGFKDIAFARLEINKNIPQLVADTGRLVPQSKIGRLIERINPKSDWTPMSKKFAFDTTLKQVYEKVDLDILNGVGETLIQSTSMLAVLNSAKALSKNGKYLNNQFEETDDIKQAISMYDAYDNDKTEYIKLNEVVAGFEIHGKRIQESENTEFYLSYFIRELNKNLQGDYDVNSVSEARRTVVGKLALVLRRWYPATAMRRVRGFSSVLKNSAEIDTDEAYYNRATREEEEGYYTTFVRMMYSVVKEAKRLKFEQGRGIGAATIESFKTVKSRQLKFERANTAQFVGGSALNLLYLGLSTVLYSLGKTIDDDDKVTKKSLYLMAYWILRAQRDLGAYTNPNEILRMANSPSVVLKQIKEMTDIFIALGAEVGHQFNEPFSLRRYERTRRKGQSKTWKEVTDVVPIFKQLDKTIEEQLSYMTNVKGF